MKDLKHRLQQSISNTERLIGKMEKRIDVLREGGDETAIARAELSNCVAEMRGALESLTIIKLDKHTKRI